VHEREYQERIRYKQTICDEDKIICPTCNGAQYVSFGRMPGHVLFGKAEPCPTCWGKP